VVSISAQRGERIVLELEHASVTFPVIPLPRLAIPQGR